MLVTGVHRHLRALPWGAGPGRAVSAEVRSCFCCLAWCERKAWTGDGVQSESDGFLWAESGHRLVLLFFDVDPHGVKAAAKSKGTESGLLR